MIAASKNPKLKIYVSEWNAQSTDWRTGLYCGGLLNAFERCGDVLEIGGPALFLRHVSASAWDNAFVNFDHRTWFPAPNYVVMKLWREHYAPQRIALEGHADPLNVVATSSEDGKTLVVKAVNPSDAAVPVVLKLAGSAAGEATLHVVAPGDAGRPKHAGSSRCRPAEEGGGATGRLDATVHTAADFLWRCRDPS